MAVTVGNLRTHYLMPETRIKNTCFSKLMIMSLCYSFLIIPMHSEFGCLTSFLIRNIILRWEFCFMSLFQRSFQFQNILSAQPRSSITKQSNEIKATENRPAQIRVTIIEKQLFYVTLCMTSNFKHRYFFNECLAPVRHFLSVTGYSMLVVLKVMV